jgi:pimeloyl-CoA dehydrogenase small subunit
VDFDLSDEQRLLKESVERLLADRYDFEARKRYAKEPDGFSPAMWNTYAEQGLLAVPFAEEDGGIGGGTVETLIVMEAFGHALALEPYLATVVLGGGLIRHAASPAQRADWLPGLIGGETRLAFAHAERQARYDLADVGVQARREGDGWVIEGEKSLVLNGDSAHALIVSARTGGGRREREGIGLFRVEASAPGLSRRGYPTQDGGRAAEVSLSSVRVGAGAVLGDPGGALPMIERVTDEAIAALCAEATGAMARMHGLTTDYMKERKQFGVTIGSFQALQHRAVDMYVALEQARSMTFLATMMAADEDATERARSIAAAKVQIGRSAKIVGQGAIQLHGGVGMTMEYAVGHYFKRVTMIDTLFGDADHHLGRVAAMGGLIAA